MLPEVRNRRGAALFMALLVSIAIGGIALGGVLLASGATLSTRYNAEEAKLQSSADGGLEIIRDSLNRGIFDSLLPLSGFTTLASAVAVKDAYGNTLPRINLSLYVGRTGGRTGGAATAGQYGSNFASALSVISDARGAVAARRLLLTQESWAKFAVAINNWSNGGVVYGCGESVNGPFFSNTTLGLQTGCGAGSGTLFASSVSVVGSINGVGSGRFTQGYKTGVTAVPWPTAARINLMQQYAQDGDAIDGDYDIAADSANPTMPRVRIEFLTVDVNGNGIIDADEGFMRVWVAANAAGVTSDTALAYATARRWPWMDGTTGVPQHLANAAVSTNPDPNMFSQNCGGKVQIGGVGTDTLEFHTADSIYVATYAAGGAGSAAAARLKVQAVLADTSTRHCYLGGDPHLFPWATRDSLTPDSTITKTFGWWKKRRSGIWAGVATVRSGDASYLIPLGANPNFKGVIFVRGNVALSGRLRGRVSVFATGNIVMADDLLYQNPPGTNCGSTGDIFGAIATKNVVIEDNNVQVPFRVNGKVYGGFDDTGDANYNMFLLAAGSGGVTGNWYAEGVLGPGDGNGNTMLTAEPNVANASWDISAINQKCLIAGAATNGCVRVTGGLAEGRIDYATYWDTGNYGWNEAHTYDACGAVNPPPYFPTTGRFIASRYFELDPVWLNAVGIANYFTQLQSQ
jgi:hypothetical protein